MHLKQAHPHLSVVLSIGGGNSSEIFPIVASSTLLRDNFGRSARGLVEASGLDGIDSGTSPFLPLFLSLSLSLSNCFEPAGRKINRWNQSAGNTPPTLSKALTSLPFLLLSVFTFRKNSSSLRRRYRREPRSSSTFPSRKPLLTSTTST